MIRPARTTTVSPEGGGKNDAGVQRSVARQGGRQRKRPASIALRGRGLPREPRGGTQAAGRKNDRERAWDPPGNGVTLPVTLTKLRRRVVRHPATNRVNTTFSI